MTFKRALGWSLFWIGLSITTGVVISLNNPVLGLQFLTGWIIEKSLSVDNLFVFLMLFSYFGVDLVSQRRVLNYGIIGVILARGILIFGGVALINQFEWLLLVLGAIVFYTGILMVVRKDDDEFDGDKNWIVRFVRRMIPVTEGYHGSKFFVRHDGKLSATPLLVALCVVEISDVMFSFDSLPAILSISRNPFIVYSSNLLAVLGLRSLYFLLVRMQSSFVHVKKAVGVILWFVGLKMILPFFSPRLEISTSASLVVIVSLLGIGVIASLASKRS